MSLSKYKHITRKKIFIGCVIAFIALLSVGRLYLPYIVKDYVNKQIAALDGYSGSVADIDLHLWRGAYQIEGFNIFKENGGEERPFVSAATIDLNIEWRALLHGAFVGEVDIYDIDLNFAKTQTGEGAGWIGFVDTLTPLDINRLEIHGGKIAYLDGNASPPINIYLDAIEAKVTNLEAIEGDGNTLPSALSVTGSSVGGGTFTMQGNLNILKEVPDFDIDASLENASLPYFNDYARNFAAVDFETGTVGIFSELAAANGRLTGYVKILGIDISLVDVEQQDGNPINAIWESVVSVFMELFENQPQDQFAFRLPIEGDISNPEQDGWSAFLSIFQNAFGQAFSDDTDNAVSLKDALRGD